MRPDRMPDDRMRDRAPGARRRRSLFAQAIAVVVTALVALSGAGLATLAAPPASALTAAEILKSFDPSDIISDGVMFNPTTMSASAVQAFLNAKVPTCRAGYTCLKDHRQDTTSRAADPMCGPYDGRKDESAAEIIVRVGQACGVNPQVLLVTLQKEQSLVTDSWPSARQYRSATGYGCPDTAPCDAEFYGFFNQVYKAAWAFKRYTTPKGTEGAGWTKFNWFPVGRPSGVLYHPNAACGSTPVTIKNKATATLYYFTPYQPNGAALSAGFGIGNSCSAYGNRNFFLYFTSWFGSTHYAVDGAIATYWRAKGGASGALGEPVQSEVPSTAAGGGTVQRFESGTVYSSKAGTVAVRGAMLSEYTATGGPGGPLGWPRRDVAKGKQNGGGTTQRFQGGAVYTSPAGTFAVTGGVYARYGKADFQAGTLGWPAGDAVASDAAGGGSWQAFAGGRIAVTAAASSVVRGTVLKKWIQRGGEAGSLGWPKGEQTTETARGRTGTVQVFTTGRVVVLGKRSYTVTGDLHRNWASHKAQAGSLGWPAGPAVKSAANGGGWSQRFEGGGIFWSAASQAHLLTGKELALYDKRGGTEGTLGWPGTRAKVAGGWVTPFTNGAIYVSKTGTYAVLGAIGRRYTAKGGPTGTLGWPIGAARQEQGVLTQRFERGRITWTAADGAKASRK